MSSKAQSERSRASAATAAHLLLVKHPDGSRGAFGPYRVGQQVRIGRGPGADVVLQHAEVSRYHVTLRIGTNTLQILDSSANGTMVGEHVLRRAATEAPLGTPLRIGPFAIRLRAASPASPPPARASLLGRFARVRAASQVSTDPATAAPPPASPESPPAAARSVSAPGEVPVDLRRKIHRQLLDHLDLASLDKNRMKDAAMRADVRAALRRVVTRLAAELPPGVDTAELIDDLCDEALGLGPLEKLLADPTVSEIMVVDPKTIYVERGGRLHRTSLRFTDDDTVRAVIERIVTPLGRRIDESSPLVDARLPDGSRVNAIIPPLALRGPCITIRRFSKKKLGLPELIGFGALTDRMGRFLARSVVARKNVVISGGTGSGKTTLLNVLSASIPDHERIVTIEDAAELQLAQSHVVSLEARPANMEGKGELSIRDLVKNALRMRPDRIVVGECRGGEALDMLQAMNTGHEGSMTTTHANSPAEAVARLETLALMSGLDLPARAIREQIAKSIDLVVQQTRFSSDGSRKVTSITEVAGLTDSGEIDAREIFSFVRTGTGRDGKVVGEFRASGYIPSFLDEFIALGLVDEGDYL